MLNATNTTRYCILCFVKWSLTFFNIKLYIRRKCLQIALKFHNWLPFWHQKSENTVWIVIFSSALHKPWLFFTCHTLENAHWRFTNSQDVFPLRVWHDSNYNYLCTWVLYSQRWDESSPKPQSKNAIVSRVLSYGDHVKLVITQPFIVHHVGKQTTWTFCVCLVNFMSHEHHPNHKNVHYACSKLCSFLICDKNFIWLCKISVCANRVILGW